MRHLYTVEQIPGGKSHLSMINCCTAEQPSGCNGHCCRLVMWVPCFFLAIQPFRLGEKIMAESGHFGIDGRIPLLEKSDL